MSLVALAPAVYAQSLGIEGEEHASVGIYIKDVQADTMVVARDISRNVTPASVTKALTSAAALTELGAEWRFETPVELVGEPEITDSVFGGALYVRGVGDPTLESEQFADYKGFCDSVAVALKRFGINKVNGGLVIVDDMVEDGPVANWEIDDVAWSYAPGIHAVNFRDNVFRLTVRTGATTPFVPDLKVTKAVDSAVGNDQVRGIWSDRLWVFTDDPKRKSWVVNSTVPDPAAVLRHELSETLRRNGIVLGDNKISESTTATRI